MEGDAAAPPHERLLAQVLREATTNVLRHARPRQVDIVLDRHGLEVRNDGLDHPDHLDGLDHPGGPDDHPEHPGGPDDHPDGPDHHDRERAALRGLATLRDRVRDAGGELTAGRVGDRFVLATRFEERP